LRFDYGAHAAPWPAAASFELEAGGYPWRLDFAHVDFLAAHPALAEADFARLPVGLRAALVEQVLQDLLEKLENALGASVTARETVPPPRQWLTPTLAFALRFAAEGQSWQVPLRLTVGAREGAAWLAQRTLAALPQARLSPTRGEWPLSARVLAGGMSLTLDALRALSPGDVLLPPAYPAANGDLILALGENFGFRLRVADGVATVGEAIHDFYRETDMGETNPSADGATLDASALRVEIRFELERKLLPLAEVETLTPGKTFALGVDPLAPVTLTLNGQPLASARLVDLGGTLGVQVERLLTRRDAARIESESVADAETDAADA